MEIAIIGSFRQHYKAVLAAWKAIRQAGLNISSPLGSPIIEEGIEFVRFTTDDARWDDPTVQTIALHRILRAEAVYVIAPDGYVGRTTCYEIGRIVQAGRPIYFSERPLDLPLEVPQDHVVTPTELAELAEIGGLTTLHHESKTKTGERERALILGEYLES